MGFSLGKLAKGALHVLSPITNAPKLINWLGKKPQGAEEVNDYAKNQLGIGNHKEGWTNPDSSNDQLDSFLNHSQKSLFSPPKMTQTYGQMSQQASDLGGRLGLVRDRSDKAYNDAYSRFSNFADTGGWSDSDKASINQNVGRLKNIGQYGARDEAEANRLRGNGVYDEFAKTGGISDSDKANIRARGNSVGTSIFDSLKRGMDHGAAIQGRSPGYDAQSAKMARDAAHSANDASLNTELGLSDKVNAGRQWGAQGMTSSEQQLIANMLAGNTQAGSQEMAMLNSINQGKEYGTSGIANLYSTPGADLGYENSYNSLLGNLGQEEQRGVTNQQAQMDAYLRALGMKNDKNLNYANLLSGRNPNTSNFDKYGMPLINTAIGVGSSLLTGPKGK